MLSPAPTRPAVRLRPGQRRTSTARRRSSASPVLQAHFCAAVDDAGNVLTATNPTAGPWIAASIDGTALITGISCPTASFCAAVERLAETCWSRPEPDQQRGRLATGVGGLRKPAASDLFLSSALCVAVDDDGNVVASTAPTSASSGWTSANVDNSPLEAVSCPSTDHGRQLD